MSAWLDERSKSDTTWRSVWLDARCNLLGLTQLKEATNEILIPELLQLVYGYAECRPDYVRFLWWHGVELESFISFVTRPINPHFQQIMKQTADDRFDSNMLINVDEYGPTFIDRHVVDVDARRLFREALVQLRTSPLRWTSQEVMHFVEMIPISDTEAFGAIDGKQLLALDEKWMTKNLNDERTLVELSYNPGKFMETSDLIRFRHELKRLLGTPALGGFTKASID